MYYDKKHTQHISFPLGGIGSGNIGLAGNGQLIDWEIFNAANKGSRNGMSHFAVRAERNGRVIGCRILQGDIAEYTYTGLIKPITSGYVGYGWGPDNDTMCGLPHFRQHAFIGEFPFATVKLDGEKDFPATAQVHAWSPFIPGNDTASSLPAAFFNITIENTSDDTVDYTIAHVISNPWGQEAARNRYTDGMMLLDNGLPDEDFHCGQLAAVCCEPADTLTYQEYLFRGGWRDAVEAYWKDLNTAGRFVNRTYETGWRGQDHALLATHFTLSPHASHTVRFIICWYVPHRKNTWNGNADKAAEAAGLKNEWRNWYATKWHSAEDIAQVARAQAASLYKETQAFHDALFASTLPKEVLDAVSANLSVLKSPTCLRLEDGTFYGWEGVGVSWGSCEGSCAHVWNYQQALAFLFPSLERSMRESHWRYSIDENGGSHFRLQLPLGIQANTGFFRPCVDGQMGDIMKGFREWKISGDDAWLATWYPTIKKTLQYAWSDKNYDRWDPDQTGVISGRQHHTLDMELFGPNAWLEGHYLGALKAAAEMADAMHDEPFANLCRKLFAQGSRYTEEHLFNGSYYFQELDITNRSVLEGYSGPQGTLGGISTAMGYWDDEHKQIKYQIGAGCNIDMQLAQWYATLYGIGDIFDKKRNKIALKSLYKNNFRPSMRDHANQWRIYSVNDEAGLIIATWPRPETRPVIPIPYASETMTGFEYAAAAHMIGTGLVKEGLRIVKAIRNRFDGLKRNPWNEFECGNNYARSMASYGLLNCCSGFTFDHGKGTLGFHPVFKGDFTTFWALGPDWGTISISDRRATLKLIGGSYRLTELSLPFTPSKYRLNGKAVKLPVTLAAHDELIAEI